MNSFKQAVLGVGAAFLLAVIVFGSLALSMVESGLPIAGLPIQVLDIGSPLMPTLDFRQSSSDSTTDLQAIPDSREVAIPELVDSPFASSCPPPPGWSLYVVMPDDTPSSLAQRFGLSAEEFAQYNCMDLEISSLLPGSTVNRPPADVVLVPEPTAARVDQPFESEHHKQPAKAKASSCGPPSWWVVYNVRSGDTLYSLGVRTNTTVFTIQKANCLGSSVIIRVGQRLFLPVYPVVVVYPTKVRQPTPTSVKPTPNPTASPEINPPLPSPTTEVPPTGVPPTDTPPPTESPTTPPPTDPPVVTTEPPVVTTEPPIVTTVPPVVTTEPPAPVVTTESAPSPPSPTDTSVPNGLFTDNLLRSWYDLEILYPNWTLWLNIQAGL